MAIAADQAFGLAKRAVDADKRKVVIPNVAEGSDLDQLAAWGQAVAERGRITPTRPDELLTAVRKALDDKAGR